MIPLQEVLLEKGDETCKVVIYRLPGAPDIFAAVSHGQSHRGAVNVDWEASAHVDLAVGDAWVSFVEFFVAFKLQDNFNVTEHLCGDVSDAEGPSALSLSSYLIHGSGNEVTLVKPDVLGECYKRERKGGTSILQLAQYFHHPINDAAKLLDICPTVLKKICRKHGLRRWPHRKLRSIEKGIAKLESAMDQTTMPNEQVTHMQQKLEELKQEKSLLCFEHLHNQ